MDIKKFEGTTERGIIINKEITSVCLSEKFFHTEVFKITYTDKHFNINTKYLYRHLLLKTIEFTDETEFPGTLKERILYELYKYDKTRNY